MSRSWTACCLRRFCPVIRFSPSIPGFAQAWWLKPLLQLFGAFPVDPSNPLSTRAMVKAVREGRALVIFPEGRITVTGALMKVFDGPGMVADKAECADHPGPHRRRAVHAVLSSERRVRLRRFPRITLTILAPRRFTIKGTDGLSARQRRAIAGRQLYQAMSKTMFDTRMRPRRCSRRCCKRNTSMEAAPWYWRTRSANP